MTDLFNTIADQEGWNDSTKISILLQFISDHKLDPHLIAAATIIANNAGDAKPLGYDDSVEAMEYDDDLILFETEVGLYDLANDPNTPFDSVIVLGAHLDKDDAVEQAQYRAEESIPVTGSVAFSVMNPPEIVSLSDY